MAGRRPPTRSKTADAKRPGPQVELGRVREGLEKSLRSATHLTELDAAAVEAARALADKIDAWDVIVRWAYRDAAERETRPAVPQHDNVSIPSFMKALHALGLTPEARGVKGSDGERTRRVPVVAADEPFDPASV